MNRSASAPKVSMLTIQEVDEPQSPRPLTFEFPSNAVTPNSQPENPFATPGADAETQSFVTGEIEILDEKQNYDYRKHLPEVKTTAAPEEFEFMSYIIDGPCEKPWLKEYDPRKKWSTAIPFIGIFIACGLAAYLGWSGYASVEQQNYCLIYSEDFQHSSTIDPKVWNHEVQTGGFGTGEFEWTTNSTANSYIQNGILYIMPTFTEDMPGGAELLENGGSVNLTLNGCTATSEMEENCYAVTNDTEKVMVNPVQSARLTTEGKISMKYGKIEVYAKLPVGDWLWPAIWMMPEDSVYGAWPASGEIDVMESRGNADGYPTGGINAMSSTLHWGPNGNYDGWYLSHNVFTLSRGSFADEFHLFGLEWSKDRIVTYVDGLLQTVLYFSFPAGTTMWQRGNFPAKDTSVNPPVPLVDPWSQTGRPNTPFDQNFYLILSLAIGGQNAYFIDGVDGKPWVDKSPSAMWDFWQGRSTWNATWGNGTDRALAVSSINMWTLC